MSIGFKKFLQKTALLLRRAAHILLAAEATNLAENLPDGVAIGVTTGIAREEKHRATSFSEFVSRRPWGCNRFVTIYQAANKSIHTIGHCCSHEDTMSVTVWAMC